MRLLCLNGWGGTFHAALVPYLKAEETDVLCLQEVVRSPASGKDWLTYRDGDHVLPQRANLRRSRAGATGAGGELLSGGTGGVLGKADSPERADQARRLLALSDQVSEPGDLRVLCGDFNVEPDSETLHLLRAAGFEELVTARGFEGTRSAHYKKPGRFADCMLIARSEAVRRFEVVRSPEVSDHRPLVLEV